MFNLFEGLSSRHSSCYFFSEFLEACKKEKFLDSVDYQNRRVRDEKLPQHPAKTYGSDWVKIGGWKGIILTYEQIYVFPRFLEVCRERKITSQNTYDELKMSDPMLPNDPSITYGQLWHHAGAWKCIEIKKRGRAKKKGFYTFKEFLVECAKRKFTSHFDYQSRRKVDPRLPSQPQIHYQYIWEEHGGWREILPHYTKKAINRYRPQIKRIHTPFDEFIKICKGMKIVSRADYAARRHLHAKLPSNPDIFYREWFKMVGGWGFVTGRDFYTFSEFLEVCKQMNFVDRKDYKVRHKSDPKLTTYPSIFYGNDWLEAGCWKCVAKAKQLTD